MDSPFEGLDGKLYIASSAGGKYRVGSMLTLDYGITPPAPLVADFQPTSGGVGAIVRVKGNFFINVSSVTLNGQLVSFQLMSSGFIWFAVPAGATSGGIAITTINGTGTSAGTFTVQ